jgi:[ribosomal protein S18]-alanine N-acetyltransferase
VIHDIEVAPIQPADRTAITVFLHSAPWTYEHFDLPKGEAFAAPGYLARDDAGRLVGVLGCRLDRPPVASILYAALAATATPSATISALLEPAEDELQRAGACELTFVGLASWLATCLEKAGFSLRTRVISYRRWNGDVPAPADVGVTLRPAQPGDARRMAALDEAAFDPMWRYPALTHFDLIGRLPHYVVAESDGQPVGYEAGDIIWGHGHIIRLAVRPDWQGRGVGTRLLVEALRFFRANDIVMVMLNTQQDNRASRRLYERLGFAPTGEDVPALVKRLQR